MKNTGPFRISTAKAEVSLMGDCILKILIRENSEINESDILEINEAKKRLIQDKRHCVLFVCPLSGTLSKEARKLSASELVNKNAIAKGVVAKSLTMSLIGNFFINFNRPPAPTQIFKNEKDALKWLHEMNAKELAYSYQ